MLKAALLVAVAGMSMTTSPGTAAEPQASIACDDGCLRQQLSAYLDALAAHAPDRLRWTTEARFTENSVELRPGSGLWATADSIGAVREVFTDPARGSAVFFGTVVENGNPAILGLRLKLVGGRIAEAEHIVGRNPGAAAHFAARHDTDRMTRASADGGATRGVLEAAPASYFNAIEAVSTEHARFSPECNRVENGQQTTNVADLANGPFLELDSPSWRSVLALGCEASIASGANAHITEARARRIIAIDEKAGVAVAAVIFDHTGTVSEAQKPGYAPITFPRQLRQPFDTLIFEAFKLDDQGRIARIEAVGTTLPLGIASGWEDDPTVR